MIRVNTSFLQLEQNYLFSTIAQKVNEYRTHNPDTTLVNLGIGDTVLPLSPTVVGAWTDAVQEMGDVDGYRGYGPEQGYSFLRSAIAEHEYCAHGVMLDEHEIFISDGAKCDSANIQELFGTSVRVAIPNPVYPVYYDSNVIAGRKEHLYFLHAKKEDGLVVVPDESARTSYDLIYLCYPNNPTGVSATREQLKRWVEYAHKNRALIIFDAAYERFITNNSIPHSIYEIDGAKEVAIEMRSYSKTAGFTGVRCAFAVIPQQCRVYDDEKSVLLHPLWFRRCATKFNGVSYPVQRAAAATYTENGSKEVAASVRYYQENARIIRDALDGAHLEYYGGVDSPYIWLSTGSRYDSWGLFDLLLKEANIVTTPGVGFGSSGEGYIRISAFNQREQIVQASIRIAERLKSS